MITGALVGLTVMGIVVGPFAMWIALDRHFDLSFGTGLAGLLLTYGLVIGAAIGAL